MTNFPNPITPQAESWEEERNQLVQVIADLNQRLIERTQGMLSKQSEYLTRARKAELKYSKLVTRLGFLPVE